MLYYPLRSTRQGVWNEKSEGRAQFIWVTVGDFAMIPPEIQIISGTGSGRKSLKTLLKTKIYIVLFERLPESCRDEPFHL